MSPVVALLAGAGIATVAGETDPEPLVAPADPRSVVTITTWQATMFALEAADGTGWFGVDLDRAAPVASGLPPMSYLVVAWLEHGTGPAVDAARHVMPVPDGSLPPPELRYPTVVLTLFVADVAAHEDAAAPADPTRSTGGAPDHWLQPQLDVGAPCSTVANFVDDTLNRIFDALHIDAAAAADTRAARSAAVSPERSAAP